MSLRLDSDAQTNFLVSLKVVIEHINTDSEVSSVVRIGAIPALGTKLSSFNYHSMEVYQGEEDALELIFSCAHFHRVLYYTRHIDMGVNVIL